MADIKKDSFRVLTDTDAGAFDILLKLTGHTKASFGKYMDIDVTILDEPPKWAYNYLQDIIEVNLIHLGYIMKDTKVSGLMGVYNSLVDKINVEVNAGTLTGNQPITINSSIITEDGPIKASFLVNAENILKDFLETAGQ